MKILNHQIFASVAKLAQASKKKKFQKYYSKIGILNKSYSYWKVLEILVRPFICIDIQKNKIVLSVTILSICLFTCLFAWRIWGEGALAFPIWARVNGRQRTWRKSR